jgi:hypothetical protein
MTAVGDRVRFVSSDDPYTRLKPGTEGDRWTVIEEDAPANADRPPGTSGSWGEA